MPTAFEPGRPSARMIAARQETPVATIAGRCMLESGDEYPCTVRVITPQGANISVKAPVSKNMAVICYLDNIGILQGIVRETSVDGFHFTFDMTDNRRARVAARIEWHATRAAEAAEHRASPRIVPVERRTKVRLSEHLIVDATIVDLSMSGVALSLDERFVPFIGSVVKIGKRFATVVRPIDGGFAAEFKLPFNPEAFTPQVVL